MKRNDGVELSELTRVEAHMRHPAAFALLASALFVPAQAFADLSSPEQEACSSKSASDACARPDGSPGVCVARFYPGKSRARLLCDAAPAASATPSATPPPSASTAPSAPAPTPVAAQPAVSAAPAPEANGGCSLLPGRSAGSALGAILTGVAVALLAARKKRP